MSANTASRRQRFARKLRESNKLFGHLVSGFLAFYIVIDILTGFLFSWTPDGDGPDILRDNPLFAFLGVLVIPLAMLITFVGTIWVYDNERSRNDLNWTRRVWGAIFLFIATFVALVFTPAGLGPIPLIGLCIIWIIGRVRHED